MKNIDKEYLKNIVNSSHSKKECLVKLNLHPTSSTSYKLLNYYLAIYEIDVSHYKGYSYNGDKRKNNKIPLNDILNGLHPLYPISKLRIRLIKENIFQHECNRCKNTHWMEDIIPLQLEHKDGNPTNHELDNLELLCPNCHAQTKTYCGKNSKKQSKKKIISENYKIKNNERAMKNQNRIQMILESNIDFSRYGWVNMVSDLISIKPQKVNAWMMKHMPRFYHDNCFKRKRS